MVLGDLLDERPIQDDRDELPLLFTLKPPVAGDS